MSGGYSQWELGWASAQILKHPYFTTETCDIDLVVPFVPCVANRPIQSLTGLWPKLIRFTLCRVFDAFDVWFLVWV